MAGLQPTADAAQIGNTNMSAGGSTVNGQPSNQLAPNLVASVKPNNTLTAQDHAIFANHAQLAGDTLLNLATRYSTSDIAANANRVAGRRVMIERTAHARLSNAIKGHAARSGQTPAQVRTALTETRKAAGVKACFKASVKVSDGANDTAGNDQEHTGDTTEDESDADAEEVFTARPVSSPARPASGPAPTVPTSTLSAGDQYLFNNSENLHGEILLALAERYSNVDISRHITMRFGTDPTTIGASGMSLRVTRALKIRAKATNQTLEQVRNTLKQVREANGVIINNQKPTVQPASQAVVATETPTAAAQEGMDVEMADASTGDNQQRYTAAEMDAAHALLLMCQAPSQDVLDAASILMDIQRDDGAATEDEVSDTEMNDADKAEFMADFQARWRPETQM
jgi:hypothetical protein